MRIPPLSAGRQPDAMAARISPRTVRLTQLAILLSLVAAGAVTFWDQ